MPGLLSQTVQYAKVFQYGDAGNGKTVASSTFPKPIYHFDFDDGTKSIKTYYLDLFNLDKKKYEAITGFKTLEELDDNYHIDRYYDKTPESPTGYVDFEKKITEFQKDVYKTGKMEYATIVIDSLTSLEMCITNKIVKEVDGTRKLGNTLNLQDYGILINFIDRLMPELLALPCHLVMNAHILRKTDPKTEETTLMPMVKGQWLPSKLPIWFDEVYYTYAKNETTKDPKTGKLERGMKYYWQTKQGGYIKIAKTRIIPPSIGSPVDAGFSSIEQYLDYGTIK